MQRLLGAAVVLLWISAMYFLIKKDVWPMLSAQDVPPITSEQLAQLDNREHQFGIFQVNDAGRSERIGTAWHEVRHGPVLTTMTGNVLIEGFRMMPVVRIQTKTDFDKEGLLDSFRLDVYGIPMTKIHIFGERRGIYFPIDMQIGPLNRHKRLHLPESRLISESIQPFTVLPKLQVGQSWRMQVLDPMTAILSRNAKMTSVVARVTGKESIPYEGESVSCYIVETLPEQVKAWVDEEGRVLRQSTKLPGFGEIVVIMETFKPEKLQDAQVRVPARWMHDKPIEVPQDMDPVQPEAASTTLEEN